MMGRDHWEGMISYNGRGHSIRRAMKYDRFDDRYTITKKVEESSSAQEVKYRLVLEVLWVVALLYLSGVTDHWKVAQ